MNNTDEIVNKVKDRWKQGLRPNGNIIGTYKSFFYQQEKLQRNPLAKGNVDLVDTGALRKGLIVNYIRDSLFTIFSTDKKALMIAEKYGLDVYGLTKDEQIEVIWEGLMSVNKKIIDSL